MNTLLRMQLILVVSAAICSTRLIGFSTTNSSSGKVCVQVVPNICVEVRWLPILFENKIIRILKLAQKP
jgi:hypothetical protein